MADRAEKCAEEKKLVMNSTVQHLPMDCGSRYCAQHRDIWRHYEEHIRSHYPDDRELLRGIMDVLCNSAQIIDVVKWEWLAENCWSEWDESVRKSISTVMQKIDERLRTAIERRG